MQVTFEAKKAKDSGSKERGRGSVPMRPSLGGPILGQSLTLHLNKHKWWRRKRGEQKYGTHHEELILTADTLK